MRKKRVCKDEVGREVDAVKILTICIQHMTNSVIESINTASLSFKINLEDMFFVLTFPDIWDDTATTLLTEAAQEVNLISLEDVKVSDV